jgi:hypothetical protein
LVAAVVVGSLVVACRGTPQRTFSDADLLVLPTVMPPNWRLDQLNGNVHDSEGQESGAAIGFITENPPYLARALETVYRYSSASKSASQYKRFALTYFNDSSIYRTSPWEVPPGIAFSSAADQWRFGCAGSNFSTGPQDGSNSLVCDYLAQYDEFLIFFTVTTQIDDHTFMTLKELVTVITAADQRIAESLGQADTQAK